MDVDRVAKRLFSDAGLSNARLIEAAVIDPVARATIAGNEQTARDMLQAQHDVWGPRQVRWEAAYALAHSTDSHEVLRPVEKA